MSSFGVQFLSSVIKSNNKNYLNRVKDELFQSLAIGGAKFTETEMLAAIQQHVLQYRVLPSRQILEKDGFQYIDTDQPPEYYIEQLKNRAMYNAYKSFDYNMKDQVKHKFDLAKTTELIKQFNNTVSYLAIADKFKNLNEVGQEIQTQIESRKNGVPEVFIPFGWESLDETTGGTSGGDLCIFAARPGVGKSSLITYMSHHAWKQGFSPLLLTMEMTDIQISRRVFGLEGGFNPNNIRKGIPDTAIEQRLNTAVDSFSSGTPFYIVCGTSRQTVESITSLVDELRPDVLYIDAAYLISLKGSQAKTWERLSAVAEKLKELAITRNIPIIITVQFNRDATKTKTFDVATLAGSDSLGQLGSIIVAIQNAEAPNTETRRTLTIIKNREGGITEFDVHYTFDPPNFSEVKVLNIDNSEMVIEY